MPQKHSTGRSLPNSQKLRAQAQPLSSAVRFTLFQTPLGACALVFSEHGVRALLLPEATPAETEAKARALCKNPLPTLHAESLQNCPEFVKELCDKVCKHLSGRTPHVDYSAIPLDLPTCAPFHSQVWQLVRGIPAGQTLTYGEIAKRLEKPQAARAVGQAMACNPVPLVVPCHRVLGAGQKMVGFSAYGGTAIKEKILAVEVHAAMAHLTLPECASQAQRHLAAQDPIMAALIKQCGPCTFDRNTARENSKAENSHCNVFQTLARSIIGQQLSTQVARVIYERYKKLSQGSPGGEDAPTPGDILAFPPETLRGVGLSQSKIAALKDLALHSEQGKIPSAAELPSLTDEQLIERLTAIRGIGRWTVEMLLIFGMGRPNVLPVTDLGVRKGYALAYGKETLPEPKELLAVGRKLWHPYQSLAAWYLWRALEILPTPSKKPLTRKK